MVNVNNAPSVVSVPVKSAFTSKVNWITVASAALATLNETTDVLQQVLPFVPEKYKPYVTVGIIVLGGVATVIAKTFFTTTITPQSAAKVSP